MNDSYRYSSHSDTICVSNFPRKSKAADGLNRKQSFNISAQEVVELKRQKFVYSGNTDS